MKRLLKLSLLIFLVFTSGCALLPSGWELNKNPILNPDPEDSEWVTFTNPETVISPHDTSWKVYTPAYKGRLNSIKWTDALYENGATSENTYCILKDKEDNLVVKYDYYQLDVDDGHHRLSYTQKTVVASGMTSPVWALLYKNDNLMCAFKVENPAAGRWFQMPKTVLVKNDWFKK